MKDKLNEALKELNTSSHKIVCIVNSALVIAEITVTKDAQGISCPQCPAANFVETGGWTRCDCGFAYDTKQLNDILEKVNGN